ncbi:MAG: helix-turn-helix domain-containing protein [Catonella sp.]|uniref:helix-turn-helix domain-containing protein n=1 Tax=Catonella sp. TaxID=2382125 RepID=UPI003F9FE38D
MEKSEHSYVFDIDGLYVELEEQGKEEQKQKTAERFVAIRKQTGMNRKEFAEWLGIPYRTMQDWERGISQVPDYVLRLVDYKVAMEKREGRI